MFVALPSFPLPRRGSHLLDTFSPHSLQQGSTVLTTPHYTTQEAYPAVPLLQILELSPQLFESPQHGMALPFRSGSTPVTRTNITATALPPARSVSCFDTLTRFLAARVDRVAFWIFQYLWIHQDASDWAECRQDARDPDDHLRLTAGTFILFLARERIGGHSGTDQVMLLIDLTHSTKDFYLSN